MATEGSKGEAGVVAAEVEVHEFGAVLFIRAAERWQNPAKLAIVDREAIVRGNGGHVECNGRGS